MKSIVNSQIESFSPRTSTPKGKKNSSNGENEPFFIFLPSFGHTPSYLKLGPQNLGISYSIFSSQDLPKKYEEIIAQAKAATQASYSPYSKFKVGACAQVLLSDGSKLYFKGCNQQNISFPEGLCAERTCIYKIGSEHPKAVIKRLAIAAFTDDAFTSSYITPCGGCRQVLIEWVKRQENQDFEIIMHGEEKTLVTSACSLLPFAFEMD